MSISPCATKPNRLTMSVPPLQVQVAHLSVHDSVGASPKVARVEGAAVGRFRAATPREAFR